MPQQQVNDTSSAVTRTGSGRESASNRILMPTSPLVGVGAPSNFPPLTISNLRKGTVDGVTINSLCNIMGAGTLALPFAFHNASVVTALLLLLWVGALSYHAVHCMTVGCDAVGRYSYTECVVFNLLPPSVAEKEAASRASSKDQNGPSTGGGVGGRGDPLLQNNKWRKAFTVLIELVIVLSGCGTLVVYARVIGEMVPAVLLAAGFGDISPDQNFENASFFYRFFVGCLDWLFAWIAPAILFYFLSCAQTMEKLKWASIVGFGTIFYIVAIVVGYYFKAALTESTVVVGQGVRWAGFDWGIFGAVSTFAIAFRYHFNVPYFYGELQQRFPDRMMKTVAVSTGASTVLYVLTGLCGYLLFGIAVEGTSTEESLDGNTTVTSAIATSILAASKGLAASKTGHGHAHAGGNVIDSFDENDTLANIGRFGLLIHFIMSYPIISVCTRRGIHRLYLLCFGNSIVNSKGSRGGGGDSRRSAVVSRQDGLCKRTLVNLINKYELPAGIGKKIGLTQGGVASGDSNDCDDEEANQGETTTVVSSDTPPARSDKLSTNSSSADDVSVSHPEVADDTPTPFAISTEAAGLVAITSLVAHSIHGIGSIMELFGALFGVPTVMILPGLVGIRVFHPRNAGYWWLAHTNLDTTTANTSPTGPATAPVFSQSPTTASYFSDASTHGEGVSILLRGGSIHNHRGKIALLRLFSFVLVGFGCFSFVFGLCTTSA